MSKGSLFSSPSLAGIIPRLLNDGRSDCCHVIRLPFLPFYSFLFLKPIKHQHLGQSLWEMKTSFLILVCVKIPLPAFILVQFRCCSVRKSCLTLRDPMDGTPEAPLSIGFSRQEYFAISFSRGSSPLRDRTHICCVSHWQVDSLTTELPGKPWLLNSR